jgi:hypothetical protein
MEKRQQSHSEEMDELEKELKSEKQAKKLELQEAKQRRDQIRQDWKVIIQLLDTLQSSDDDGDDEESGETDAFGGDGEFSGSGAFTSGKDFSEDDTGSDGNPAWLENEFSSIEED